MIEGHVISTARSIKIQAPAGATMIRVIGDGGKVSVMSIAAACKRGNVFRGVAVESVNVGTVGRNGAFIAMSCAFGITDTTKRSPEPSAQGDGNQPKTGAEEGKDRKLMPKQKIKSKPRGGLAAVAAELAAEKKAKKKTRKAATTETSTPAVAESKPETAEVPDGSAKLSRRDRMAQLFDGTKTKAEITTIIIAEYGGEEKAVKGAVNNYPSWAMSVGKHATWKTSAKAS